MLASWAYSIDEVILEWENMGVFEWVLPFLIVFSLVFGILTKSKVLGDEAKGVNTVLALASGLLAIQSGYLRSFFQMGFGYAGVGIAILLIVLILTGLFKPEGKGGNWWTYTFFGIGMFIAVVVVLISLSTHDWSGSWWWYENYPGIITLLIIVGLILLVILATKVKRDTTT